jgi:hypothetical protein
MSTPAVDLIRMTPDGEPIRARMRVRETAPPSLDDEFIGGLTYKEYFALSEEEEKALWDKVFADEAMEVENFTEVEVAPDARVPS